MLSLWFLIELFCLSAHCSAVCACVFYCYNYYCFILWRISLRIRAQLSGSISFSGRVWVLNKRKRRVFWERDKSLFRTSCKQGYVTSTHPPGWKSLHCLYTRTEVLLRLARTDICNWSQWRTRSAYETTLHFFMLGQNQSIESTHRAVLRAFFSLIFS